MKAAGRPAAQACSTAWCPILLACDEATPDQSARRPRWVQVVGWAACRAQLQMPANCPYPFLPPLSLQVVLAVVLNPTSPIGRKWRRLRQAAAEGALGARGSRVPGSSDEAEEDEEGGAGYDTRLYASHMSDRQASAEAELQRQARQQQLEEEGLTLTPYDAVRATVRDRLLPTGTPPSAGVPGRTPPKRRLSLGGSPSSSPAQPGVNGHGGSPAQLSSNGGGSPGGIEMAALAVPHRSRGDLSPIAESLADSPRSSHSLV